MSGQLWTSLYGTAGVGGSGGDATRIMVPFSSVIGRLTALLALALLLRSIRRTTTSKPLF